MSTVMYLDVETTGLGNAEIIQLSYLLTTNGVVYSKFDKFFRINGSIDLGALEVHGLSRRKLEGLGQSYFDDYIPELLRVIKNVDEIVGHNISFDLRQIKTYMNRELNVELSKKKITCTQNDYKKIFHKEITTETGVWSNCQLTLQEALATLINHHGHSLQDIYTRYRTLVNREPRLHDSMFDVYVTYLVHSEALRQG